MSYKMIDYICPSNGQPYRLSSDEACICRQEPNGYSLQHKNALWEMIWADQNFLYRGFDISNYPAGTVYAQYTGSKYGAPWAKAQMSMGEVFERSPIVNVYAAATGKLISSDLVVTYLKVVNHYAAWQSPSGRTVYDVIELQYSFSPDFSAVAEHYFYANGLGLVGFSDGKLTTFITTDTPPVSRFATVQSLGWFSYPPITSPALPTAFAQKVTTQASNVRSSPTTSAPILLTLAVGQGIEVADPIVETTANTYKWAQVRVNGVNGFVALVTSAWEVQFVSALKIVAAETVSQWGWASGRTGLCGPTTLTMLLKFARKAFKWTPEITPDTIANWIGMGAHDGSTLETLVKAGAAYGLALTSTAGSWSAVKLGIDGGKPVGVLLDYSLLPERADQNFKGLHILLVIGYSDQYVYTNDPDYVGTAGASKKYALAGFVSAIKGVLTYAD